MLIKAIHHHRARRIDRLERITIERDERKVHGVRQVLFRVDRGRKHIDELRTAPYEPDGTVDVDSFAHVPGFPIEVGMKPCGEQFVPSEILEVALDLVEFDPSENASTRLPQVVGTILLRHHAPAVARPVGEAEFPPRGFTAIAIHRWWSLLLDVL